MPLVHLTYEEIEEVSNLLEFYVERPALTGTKVEWVTAPKPVHQQMRVIVNDHLDSREKSEGRGHTS